MRITISATGVAVDQVRQLAAACSQAHAGAIRVVCDGPELFTVETEPLRPSQFAEIVGRLVTWHGTPIGEALAS